MSFTKAVAELQSNIYIYCFKCIFFQLSS